MCIGLFDLLLDGRSNRRSWGNPGFFGRRRTLLSNGRLRILFLRNCFERPTDNLAQPTDRS